MLVEAMDRMLPTYPPDRSASARRQLERLGVTVRTETRVVDVDDGARCASRRRRARPRRSEARTVLWAAGVLASSFGRKVAAATGRRDRPQRPDPRRAGPDGPRPPGDLRRRRRGGPAVEARPAPSPGVAQGGIQGGSLRGARRSSPGCAARPIKPFRYSNHGDVAVIGRLRGVTDIPWMGPFGRQSGFTAWLLWLGIHIVYLIGFANRIVVTTRWAFSFLTRGRSTRLITGQPLVPPIEEPAPSMASSRRTGRGREQRRSTRPRQRRKPMAMRRPPTSASGRPGGSRSGCRGSRRRSRPAARSRARSPPPR